MSDAIRNAGAKLANIAFNLVQRKDLPADIIACLDASRKEWDAAVRAPSAPLAREVPKGYALTLIDRSYDQRVKAIIAHNSCGGDLDDKLKAAYEAAIYASPNPPLPGEAT